MLAGAVRREAVSARPAPASAAIAASARPSAAASPGSKRWRRLAPPTSTATSGRGRCARSGAKRSPAAARRAGVTRCSAVRVSTTLAPLTPSWRGATTRSKRAGETRGSWTKTVKQRATRRSRSASPTALRPPAMSSSGQGGCSGSLPGASAPSGGSGHGAGRCRHGAAGEARLTSGSSPIASARPRHWFSVPAIPSVSTQQRVIARLTRRA